MTDDKTALKMVEKTLQEMRLGGIFDHVGYGFHRYATDKEWLVPHFEKLLYDQAMLVMAYTEAFQITGKPEYKKTAEEILAFYKYGPFKNYNLLLARKIPNSSRIYLI